MVRFEYTSQAKTVTDDLILFENTYGQFSCPKHFHETYQIEIIKQGIKRTYFNGFSHTFQRGAILIINPGEIHTGGNADSTALICKAFYPEPNAWEEILGYSYPGIQKLQDAAIPFHSAVLYDEGIVNDIEHLFELTHTNESELLLKEVYQRVMLRILKKQASSPLALDENVLKYTSVIHRAKEYINDNIAGSLLLEDIARAAFISPFHFLRVFKKVSGITLHQYILSLKVERAKQLLCQKTSIADTLHTLGFKDQAHFTKVFKKITALTPKQYRNLFER